MNVEADIRKGRHCVHELSAHLVFVTKYPRDVFTAPMLTRCEEITRDVCTGFGCELMEFNGEDDHVHLLVGFPPKIALSALINSLKGVSARYLRKEYDAHVRRYLWSGHFWSRSYYAGSTIGSAPRLTYGVECDELTSEQGAYTRAKAACVASFSPSCKGR